MTSANLKRAALILSAIASVTFSALTGIGIAMLRGMLP